MLLNVGCGSFPNGDVNCDLFLDLGHMKGDKNKKIKVNIKKIKNFIKSDAQHLPFRSNVFDQVISSHVIEHVLNPVKMLDELVRVSNNKIIIECPHWLGDRMHKKNPYHINFFKSKWFKKYADTRNLFYYKSTEVIKRTKRDYILNFFGIQNQITVEFIKPT